MDIVEKEMNELKTKASSEEVKRSRDEYIKELKKEMVFFREESLKLDTMSKSFKKEYEKWKQKAEALREDNDFLQDKVIETKSELNKVKLQLREYEDQKIMQDSSILKMLDNTSKDMDYSKSKVNYDLSLKDSTIEIQNKNNEN